GQSGRRRRGDQGGNEGLGGGNGGRRQRMDPRDEVSLWHALYHLEATYWHEVDHNGGRRAHEFYAPDGVMAVGHNRFEGRENIREFYAWRERQALTAISSVKTTRHLINNLIFESSAERPETWLEVYCMFV